MAIDIDLKGSACLVTGASRGIGRACAAWIGRAGAHVQVHYVREREAAEDVVRAIEKAGGSAEIVQADLLEPGACAELARVCGKSAHVQHLVLNAGIWERTPLEAPDLDLVARHLNLHVLANIALVSEMLPGLSQGSSLVAIASTAGQRGEPFYSAYAASKAAIVGWVKSAAVELAPRGIRVNSVAPGWVDTDMTAAVLQGDYRRRVIEGIPLGLIASPEDIAGPVLFLLSPLSRHLTGSTLSVNGGSVLD